MREESAFGRIDRGFRWRLAGISLCWLLLTISSSLISDIALWFPKATALLSLACAACTAALALRPSLDIAYRWGGALAIGALVLRGGSILAAQVRDQNDDYLWAFVANLGLTIMLAFLYANWWLVDVKQWHQTHRIIDR
jgi:hypothetical protein